MYIPENAIIPREKLAEYLLMFRPRNDKSHYLARAGFNRNNYLALEAAIRRHVRENEGRLGRTDEYGEFFRVEGQLRGPDGILSVVTIWIRPHEQSEFRFVTLKPAR